MRPKMFKQIVAAIVIMFPTLAFCQSFQLPGSSEWYDTGISLYAGEVVTITASGSVYIGDVGSFAYETPAGDSDYTTSQFYLPFVAPGLVPWSLVGKIGSGGTPFQLGTTAIFTASTSGELYLSINDNNFGDNSGSWSISVSLPPTNVTLTISACQGGSVSYQSTSVGSGTVSGGQSFPLQVPVGSSVTLTARPTAADEKFAAWSPSSGISGVPDGSPVATNSPSISIVVNTNSQISANFSLTCSPSPTPLLQQNWSGYIVGVQDTNGNWQSGAVNDIKGTWVVPTIQFCTSSDAYSSTWIGIGGYQVNGGPFFAPLVQIGTHQDCNNGSPNYYAWWEVVGYSLHSLEGQQIIPTSEFPVNPNDEITAEITYTGSGNYYIQMFNVSQNVSFSVNWNAPLDSQQTAEWIVEDPENGFGDLYPLTDFGTVNFNNCYVILNSAEGPINSCGATNILAQMVTGSGNLIAPSSLSYDGTSFSIAYQPQTSTGTPLAINITDSPSDGGTNNGSVIVYSNSVATVIATPNSCFAFENWTENGVYLTNSPIYSFIATSNENLTANFVTNIYTITTSSSPSDGGTVTGAATVDCGASVTLVASNNPGYSFAGWTWINDGVTNWITDLSPFTFTVSANSNLVANFVPLGSSTITTLVSPPSAGSTTGGGTYTNEVTATITATAAPCYSFLYWTTNGVPFSFSPTNMISVTTNEVFTANFTPISYDIDVSASAGGTVSGGGSYNCGNAVTLLATPNPCYSFVNWTENGSLVSGLADFYFVVDTNHNFVANFAPTTSTVSTSSSPANGGTTSGGGTFGCEFSVAMTAEANSGYAFANWTENGVIINTSPNFTFTASGNHSLVANFVPNVILGFGSPLWSVNGLDMILQGPIESNYEIDASTDLFNWMPLTNFVIISSPFYFSDPAATNFNQRFYRAVMQ